MKEHVLKLETNYYQDVESGKKCFEVRKNDRNFKVGDYVKFKEIVTTCNSGEIETGRMSEVYTIKYIFEGGQYGLDVGFCVFGIEALI